MILVKSSFITALILLPVLSFAEQSTEELAKAAYDQIINCGYTHPTMFTTQPVEELSNMLASHSPRGIERFYFLSGGAEAVEASIKLARQIQIENGRSRRTRLISRWNSYHGMTIGALSATGRKSCRAPFLPLLPETIALVTSPGGAAIRDFLQIIERRFPDVHIQI